MQLLRSLMTLAMIAAVAYVGATVPLGEKTLFGHFRAIWGSEEAQQLVDGVRESSGPVLEKIDRAVTAGVEEARRQTSDEPGADSPKPAVGDARAPGEARAVGGEARAVGGDARAGGEALASGDEPRGAGEPRADDDHGADIELRPQIDIRVSP